MNTEHDTTAQQPTAHCRQGRCPAWCIESRDDCGPEGFLWHLGPITHLYLTSRDGETLPATLRAEYLDFPPGYATQPGEPENTPVITLEIPADGTRLALTLAQARQLTVALTITGDTVTAHPIPPHR
jgi:hypothetical protein